MGGQKEFLVQCAGLSARALDRDGPILTQGAALRIGRQGDGGRGPDHLDHGAGFLGLILDRQEWVSGIVETDARAGTFQQGFGDEKAEPPSPRSRGERVFGRGRGG